MQVLTVNTGLDSKHAKRDAKTKPSQRGLRMKCIDTFCEGYDLKRICARRAHGYSRKGHLHGVLSPEKPEAYTRSMQDTKGQRAPSLLRGMRAAGVGLNGGSSNARFTFLQGGSNTPPTPKPIIKDSYSKNFILFGSPCYHKYPNSCYTA
jgi:hypothetical protein